MKEQKIVPKFESGYKITKNIWAMADVVKSQTAEELYINALRYFELCDRNPIYKPELIRAGALSGTVMNTPLQRPYTMSGLCLHLGCSQDYLVSCARSETQNDFYFVANKLIEIIKTQTTELALVGVVSPIISAKILGLDTTTKADPISPNIYISVESSGPALSSSEFEEKQLPESTG